MTEHEKLTEAIQKGLNGKVAYYFAKNVAPALAEYLIKEGVIVPLLQTGQIVYRVSKNKMWEVKIWKIEIQGKTVSYIDNYDKSFLDIHIGKGVFLTKEEAERALRKEDEGK